MTAHGPEHQSIGRLDHADFLRKPEIVVVLRRRRDRSGADGAGDYRCTIRLPANQVFQERIAHLLRRPVDRPPIEVRRYYANFSYQAQSWKTPRRVVAKVEWHPGELYPRVGFIVTNLSRPTERVVAFYTGAARPSNG